MNARKLTTLAMLTAISIVLVYLIRIPMFLPFLEYDPADIPIFLATLSFGPATGLILTVVVSLLQGLTVSAGSGWIGIAMHILATGSFVLVAGLLHRRFAGWKGACAAMGCGVATMTCVMLLWNYLLTPIFMNMPRAEVVPYLLPAFLPFNLIKAGGNALVALVLYRYLGGFLKGRITA